MNNNLKQAFSEVFGKSKDESTDFISEQSVENKNSENNENIPFPIEQSFDNFEELQPTGQTMSDEERALIDKKAAEFKKNLGLKLKQSKENTDTNKDVIEQKFKNQKSDFDVIINDKGNILKKERKIVKPLQTKNNNTQTKEYKVYDFKSEFNKKLTNDENFDNENQIKNFETENNTIEQVNDKNIQPVHNNSNEISYTPSYSLKPVATTFIDEKTKMEGSLVSESNLNISGELKGDITCSNDVIVSGKVVGNIICENFVGDKSVIEGNINAKNSLVLKNGSTITGDVSSNVIKVSGKINGNIISASDLSIFENSAVYGDITSKSIFVEKDSIIQGNVNIKSE